MERAPAMRSSCAGPMMDCGVRAARVRARCQQGAQAIPSRPPLFVFANVKCS